MGSPSPSASFKSVHGAKIGLGLLGNGGSIMPGLISSDNGRRRCCAWAQLWQPRAWRTRVGRDRLQGTGSILILQVVTLYKRGESPEEIAENFPQVTLGQVYTALAYYHANRAEVERELADELAESDLLQTQCAAPTGPPGA
jgi:uncharacterized protein (DUF433 family)